MARPPTVTREATSRWTLAWQGSLADRVPVPVWLGLLTRAVKWCALRPVKTGVAVLLAATLIKWGLWAGAGAGAVLVGLAAILGSPGWAASGRVGRAYRACQARGKLRRAWPGLMADVGLVGSNNQPLAHAWFTTTSTGVATTVHNGAIGKTSDDIRSQARRIAGLLDVHSVRARELTAAQTRITIHQTNPFGPTVRLSQLPRVTTRSQVPLGIDDEGEPILWNLGLHTLLLGETGSGKSSCIWVAVEGMQHWTDQGRPELDVIDLKEGVELGALDPALGGIARHYTEDPKTAERLIHNTAREGTRRMGLMKANGWRGWRPEYAGVLGPRRVLLIDEFLALPKKIVRPGEGPLWEVLFKHRAAGISVIGASQLSQVDAGAVGRLRNLFPIKIILSMESQGMVTAVAGGESAEAPAHTLQLPADAGRFFIRQEGRSGWVAGKAAFVDDEAGEHLPIARGQVTA